MTSQAETLREKASRLMNKYEATGPRPGGESAYAEAMTAYQQLLAEHPEDASCSYCRATGDFPDPAGPHMKMTRPISATLALKCFAILSCLAEAGPGADFRGLAVAGGLILYAR